MRLALLFPWVVFMAQIGDFCDWVAFVCRTVSDGDSRPISWPNFVTYDVAGVAITRGGRGESIPTLGGINRPIFEEILTKFCQSIRQDRGLDGDQRRQNQRFSNDLKADDEEIKP